jgi:hypothetical protein
MKICMPGEWAVTTPYGFAPFADGAFSVRKVLVKNNQYRWVRGDSISIKSGRLPVR